MAAVVALIWLPSISTSAEAKAALPLATDALAAPLWLSVVALTNTPSSRNVTSPNELLASILTLAWARAELSPKFWALARTFNPSMVTSPFDAVTSTLALARTLVMVLPADLFPRSVVGSIAGLVGLGGALGGIVFGQIAGYLLDHAFGYNVVFALAGTFHVIAFLIILAAIPTIRPAELEQRLRLQKA